MVNYDGRFFFEGVCMRKAFADDLHVRLSVEDRLEPFPDCLVIVGEKNA